MASSFGFRVWGARGSLPRLTEAQTRLGGNTICLEVLHPGEQRVILDAGTGIANLGDQVLSENPKGASIHLFLSHYHWDHIMGLPFFGPVYRKGFTIELYGLRSGDGHVQEMLNTVFSPSYSPIYSPDNLLGNLSMSPPKDQHAIDDLKMSCYEMPGIHPGGLMITRVAHGDRSFVYASDVELRDSAVVDEFERCCSGCDLLICDAAFSQVEYEDCVGRGHSSLERAYEVAHRAGIKRLMGIHFDPLRTDAELDAVLERERDRYPDTQLEIAREGDEVLLS